MIDEVESRLRTAIDLQDAVTRKGWWFLLGAVFRGFMREALF